MNNTNNREHFTGLTFRELRDLGLPVVQINGKKYSVSGIMNHLKNNYGAKVPHTQKLFTEQQLNNVFRYLNPVYIHTNRNILRKIYTAQLNSKKLRLNRNN